jgi:hypothetical protein
VARALELSEEDNPWAYEEGEAFPRPRHPRDRKRGKDYGAIWNRKTRRAELVIAGVDRTYFMPLGPNEIEDFAFCLLRLRPRYRRRDWR